MVSNRCYSLTDRIAFFYLSRWSDKLGSISDNPRQFDPNGFNLSSRIPRRTRFERASRADEVFRERRHLLPAESNEIGNASQVIAAKPLGAFKLLGPK